jgi:hypothetical protein
MGRVMMHLRAILSGLVLGSLTACGPGVTNEELRAKLDQRARFDLDCDTLRVRALEHTNGYTVSYGVTGCGHRATYVLNGTTLSWVMNAADGRPTGRTSEEAPRRAPPPAPPPH